MNVKWTGEHLRSTVREMLRNRGYDRECLPLEDVAFEIGETIQNLSRKVKLYKWPGMILLVLIPVISTSLSVLVTRSQRPSGIVIPLAVVESLSYGLTLLTLFNSIFAPRERFTSLCHMGIPLHEVAITFLAKLETLQAPKQHELHALAAEYERILFPYKKGLISLFLPQTDVTSIRNMSRGGKRNGVLESVRNGRTAAHEPPKRMKAHA